MLYMLDRHDYGRLFILNFLVVYFSFLGEIKTNNLVNVRYVSYIQPNVDVKSFDWCSYIVSCLNQTKKALHSADDAYRGPMVLLAIAYAIEKKSIPSAHSSPVIELVDDDVLEKLHAEMGNLHSDQQRNKM
ncbi:hypothetical protein Hdeb2414_s0003g00109361 [Helianthus debilis subsp. tardiflorus]